MTPVPTSCEMMKSIDLISAEPHSNMISGNEKKCQFNVCKNIIPVKIIIYIELPFRNWKLKK